MIKIKQRYKNCEQINFHAIDRESVQESVVEDFNKVIRMNANAFADSNRSYPCQVQLSDFVNTEIESLLRDGIIRKSFSVYNSPVLVV